MTVDIEYLDEKKEFTKKKQQWADRLFPKGRFYAIWDQFSKDTVIGRRSGNFLIRKNCGKVRLMFIKSFDATVLSLLS
jgi:hypothetical protein